MNVDTWTDARVRPAAARYMVNTTSAPLTFSGAHTDRWSERAVIVVALL
jgi:hypothetical protein